MSIRRALAIAGGSLLGAGGLLFAWIWSAPCFLGGCAPLDELALYQVEGSELLDLHGEPFAHLATSSRRIVPLDSLPDELIHAVVAIEDRRFFQHHGIDFRRTFGALLINLRSGAVNEGGSTITQQLARNLFPEALPYRERSVRRKILEARVARQIERRFRKEKILELYLNHVYLGNGAYGIEAAARTYFGKGASELTLGEAATLAGLPQAPSQINPREDLERATRRRDLVLTRMVESGYLDPEIADAAREEPIRLARTPAGGGARSGAYFIERVRRELEERIGTRFDTDGLQVYTTFDPVAQAAAEGELARQLEEIEAGRFGRYPHPRYTPGGGENDYLQGAVVVMDVRSGAVLALVGGRDYADSAFDRASFALRQPGSAFKPFVYAAGLEHFRTPAHQVEDAPLRVMLGGGQSWEPRNYTGQYDGMITLREALARSKNTATVRLAQEVGLTSIIRTAHDLGITSEIQPLPSTILGAAEVRPLELAQAYAAFANGGERIEPYLIRKVVDRRGRVLWEADPNRIRVLDPAIAFVLTSMLQDAIDEGTGAAVRAAGFRGAAAGKTGTTNDAADVWFIGYTPELVAAIWIGFDTPTTILRGASGGTFAAPAWGRMMRRIYATRTEAKGWPVPPGILAVSLDRGTGAPVSEWCPPRGAIYTEYFIGTAPPAQSCPRADFAPRPAWQDSIWYDEEWGDPAGRLPLRRLPPGLEWPDFGPIPTPGADDGLPPDPARDPGALEPPGTQAPPRILGEPLEAEGDRGSRGDPAGPFVSPPPPPAEEETTGEEHGSPRSTPDPTEAAPARPPRLLGVPAAGPS